MCTHCGECDFYQKHKDSRSNSIRRLLRDYCSRPGGELECRRELIRQYYDVRLNAGIGPAGDYLEYG